MFLNYHRKYYTLLIFVALWFITLVVSSPVNAAEANKKILLLHSYHSGYKWTDDITSAVRETIAKSGNIDLYVEYLDIKRQVSRTYMDSEVLYILRRYGYLDLDIIICADNAALNFSLKNRSVLFPGVPILFCGINSFTERMLQNHKNITGVVEAVDLRRNVELMLRLHPATKRIIVINDETDEGHDVHNKALISSTYYTNIKWYLPQSMNLDELAAEISALGKEDLILLGSFSLDFEGRHVEYDQIANLVSANSPVPIYGLWDFYLGHGIVGGRLASGSFQGTKVAEMALDIFSGSQADDIPVIMESPNHYFADYEVLQRVGLSTKQFPEDTLFINKPPDFYSTHKVKIWVTLAVLIVLSLLIILLSLAVIDKKRAEMGLRRLTVELQDRVEERTEQLSSTVAELKTSEEQMRHLLSNLSGMVYRCQNHENRTMLYMSSAAQKITSYHPDEIIDNSLISYADIIDPKDRDGVNATITEAIEKKKNFVAEYRIKNKDGTTKWVWEQGLAVYGDSGEVLYLDGIISDISDRKAIELEQKRLATVVHQTDDLVILTDLAGNIEYVNATFEEVTGYSLKAVHGKNPRFLKSGKQDPVFYEKMWETLLKGGIWRGTLTNKKKDGTEYIANVVLLPIRDDQGELVNFVGLQRDITHEISLENNLRQALKLEAMGTLAGGIAHEINTPAQYVASNLDFFQESFNDLHDFFKDFIQVLEQEKEIEKARDRLKKHLEEYDIEYLFEEMPTALTQSIDGIKQISKIVSSMKQFAHPGDETKTATNINDAISNTANVCRNEWKYVADMHLNLDPNLPEVPCHRSELNQVILNIIVNAAHAIEANKPDESEKGVISITTSQIDNGVEIAIQDTGGGIPEIIRERVFDPFFTTKEPGKGTGQGLAIAHSIITEKHGGKIFIESEAGKGTTFYIQLLADEAIPFTN